MECLVYVENAFGKGGRSNRASKWKCAKSTRASCNCSPGIDGQVLFERHSWVSPKALQRMRRIDRSRKMLGNEPPDLDPSNYAIFSHTRASGVACHRFYLR